jgi:hypothetical protein
MDNRTSEWIRRALLVTALLSGSACILQSAASPASTPPVVVVPGNGGAGSADSTVPVPTAESTDALTPTGSPALGLTDTPTIAQVTMTAGQDLSCVTGPHWILYEWVARIAEGETVILLARAAPEWDEYYFVYKSGGTPVSCWAFGGSSTIHGNPSVLPIKETPALPEITFTIRNETYLRVTSLRIRPKDDTVWGTNLLAAHPVDPQQTYGVTFTAGFYDIRILDHHDGTLYEAHDVPIGAEPSSNAIVLDGRYSVVFRSETTVDICRISIASEIGSYSADLTIPGDGRISPGEQVTLEGLGGSYDASFCRCGSSGAWYSISVIYIGPAGHDPYVIH